MKRSLLLGGIAAIMAWTLVGCSSGGDGGTNPPPTPPVRVVAAEHQSPGLTSVDSPIWDSITAVQITVGADTLYNANLPYNTSLIAQMKALVAGDSLFIRVKWNDNDRNNLFGRLHALWVNNLVQWEMVDTTSLANEDRFRIIFDNDGLNHADCAQFCHRGAVDTSRTGRHFYGAAGDNADVWDWKAHRTGLAGFAAGIIGFAEDMHISDTMVTPDPQTALNDNLYYPNPRPDVGGGVIPREMHQTGAAFTGPGLLEGEWVDYEQNQPWVDTTIIPPVGKYLPGYYMYNLTRANGSRWDVRARSEYSAGYWTLVMRRTISTTDVADISFAALDSVQVTIAICDNSGIFHYGRKPFYIIFP